MPNALILDFSISDPGVARGSAGERGPSFTVSVVSGATGVHRDKLREFFDGLVRLNDLDLRAVESVVLRLVRAEAEEAGRTADELLEEDNRRLRDRFIAELSPLRRDDVLRLARQVRPDGESVLRRWEEDRAVFSVTHHGRTYYPDFQFRDGLPTPIVQAVLSALPPELSNWQRAFWFVSANGWIHDGAPVDHFDDPALVLQAARREGEPVVG